MRLGGGCGATAPEAAGEVAQDGHGETRGRLPLPAAATAASAAAARSWRWLQVQWLTLKSMAQSKVVHLQLWPLCAVSGSPQQAASMQADHTGPVAQWLRCQWLRCQWLKVSGTGSKTVTKDLLHCASATRWLTAMKNPQPSDPGCSWLSGSLGSVAATGSRGQWLKKSVAQSQWLKCQWLKVGD